MCQSCVRVLEHGQCVAHLEPHTPCVYCRTPVSSLSYKDEDELRLQSDEADVVLTGSSVTGTTSTTVVEFLDETPGSQWKLENPERTNLMDRQPEIELAKYLSRPVLIKTHIWAQTDNYKTTTSWYPWTLFFNSTPIKNKINNYSFISCKLKLKFVINASPFYSGAMAFTYCPLQDVNGDSVISDPSGGELMGHSQRPKVWIFPQTCQGGEMELPFFYHKNWLDLTNLADVNSMGKVTPCLFAPLTSANGVSGTSVVVNIYAWAEDIKLHAPTIKLALQSDEYDYKPSQMASSVAAAAGALSRIPIIGPYMTATSVVASGVSTIASALGFTNVPNIDTVSAYRPSSFPHNSTCEISVPTDRASVDPKNEVTIDPRTVGLTGVDELDIKYIAGRESYIGSATLSSTDAVDQLTLVSRVTPALMFQHSSSTPLQFTPMAYLCQMFKHWRGDIIFRFKFICTRFHKGRVRITFDPTGNISSTIPDYTSVFNEVVDIGAEQDIEIRVPYMQATTFLRTDLQTGNYNFTGSSLAPSNTTCNGLITMRVVNPLSGPQSPSSIPVLIFARAADNIEFAWPSLRYTGLQTVSPYTLQSQEVEYAVNPCQIIAGNSVSDGDPNRNLIHYGERVSTLRPLLHRLNYQYTIKLSDVAPANTATFFFNYSSRRLRYSGFDSLGPWTANKILTAGVANYNYVRMNIPQLTSLLFVGQRGSMTWSYNLESSVANPPSNLSLKRYDSPISSSSYNVADTTTSTSPNVITEIYNKKTVDFNNGVALTDQRSQPGIAMNFPYYSQYNFQFVNPFNSIVGSSTDGTDVDNICLQTIVQKLNSVSAVPMNLNVWAACGPDYNFFFFLNAPSLYLYDVPTGV